MTSGNHGVTKHTRQLVTLVERMVQESGAPTGFAAAAHVNSWARPPAGALSLRSSGRCRAARTPDSLRRPCRPGHAFKGGDG